MSAADASQSPLLARALSAARDTRELVLGRAAKAQAPAMFARHFRDHPAIVVADLNTMPVAGEEVAASVPNCKTFVFKDPNLYAEWKFIEQLEAAMRELPANVIPIAVGAGTINDLVKLVAHRLGRQYMCVATAASMDGYTAYGASITKDGSKQTFECPSPIAVLADIDVIAAAPAKCTAAGYADLLAKVTAGADWILADALGVEKIHPQAWETVQSTLRDAVSDPAACRRREPSAIQKLTEGLMMGGFAMQAMQSSRAASGAEHQFSHLWDMQHHTHNGEAPSHGFKVGIGTLAVAELYEDLLEYEIDQLDLLETVAHAPSWSDVEETITKLFDIPELREKSLQESRAKFADAEALYKQLDRLQESWPDLRERLRVQLLPATTIAKMLADAGAPSTPEQIGISQDRLRASYRQALYIRRRFTILDVAEYLGILP